MARARCTCGHVCDVTDVAPGGKFACPECGRKLVRPGKKDGASPTHTTVARPATDTDAGDLPPAPPSGIDDATAPPAAGTNVIGGYKLVRKIQAGGMGIVYEAIQISLNRKVALKVLSARIARKPTALERFERETAILVALRHPNIVAIVDRGEHKGTPYYVMEYIAGPREDGKPLSIADLIKEGRPEPADVRNYARQIGSALHYAHSMGIVHRDIKPSNILIDNHGAAQVLDFGIAQFKETSQNSYTQEKVGIGTADFMAPEQATDAANVDGRADIYSLGVLLYLMLTGNLPKGSFDPPSRKVAGLDPRWDAIVLKALRAERDERYPSLEPMLADLEALGTPPAAPTPAGPRAATDLNPPRPAAAPETGETIESLRQAFTFAEVNYRTRVVALGQVVLGREAKATDYDAALEEPLAEVQGLRQRMARNETAEREIRALADRMADLEKKLERYRNDLSHSETEIGRQWLGIGERAWKLYQEQPSLASFEELFQVQIQFQGQLDALQAKVRKHEEDSAKAGFMGKMAAQAKKLAVIAEINIKQMSRNPPLEEAGKRVFATDFAAASGDASLIKMLRAAGERDEERKRAAETVAKLDAEKEECTAGLRRLGAGAGSPKRLDELAAEAKTLQARVDEVHAQVGESAIAGAAAKPDPSLASVLQPARQARAERDRVRLQLQSLEAQAKEDAAKKKKK